jgi:hypothetical protein
MPYVVTTKRRRQGFKVCGMDVLSRRAVATLDEATEALDAHMKSAGANGDWRLVAICKVSESGGTVGPLPDGTVIEVERVEWDYLRRAVGAVGRRGATNDPMMVVRSDQLIAAFSAREAGT